ncbi:hypothetical protein [Bacillus sp. SG-1]|uniref:hypothetical protein n=1 Tax=Bacillus sp. SG-1 TaxID=161544 RepID=UPI0001545317|nr:hypothetical protein [Bacillus sp. SG-1]EDL63175.1 hypothetical protein BSG1_09021 [Bacillus sp. SG-1]
MNWHSIGAFSFPSTWGALIAAFFVTGIFLRIYYDKNDWFGNTVFWFILTWKFSVILFDFTGVINQPLSILYFNGGLKGFWLGVAVSLIYIYIKGEREQLFIAWALIILVYEGALEFLVDSASILSAVNILIGFVFFYLLLTKGKKEIWLLVFLGLQLLINFSLGTLITTESMAYVLVTMGLLAIDRLRRVSHE